VCGILVSGQCRPGIARAADEYAAASDALRKRVQAAGGWDGDQIAAEWDARQEAAEVLITAARTHLHRA
jgi:hypothetical protein